VRDIQKTGAAWVSEAELDWLCRRVCELEAALMTIADMRVTRIAKEALDEH